MRSSRLNYIVVGLAVLAAIAAGIGAVFLVAGRQGPSVTYRVVYDSVIGIERGANVAFQGYKIGQVAGIEPVREDGRLRFAVKLRVQRDWPIPKDSVADISAPGLLASNIVNIRRGDAAQTLEPGGRLRAGETASMYTQVQELSTELSRLSQEQLTPLIDNLNRYLTALEGVVAKDTPKLMGDLRKLTQALAKNAPSIARRTDTLLKRLEQGPLSRANTARLERILANSDRFAANMAELTSKLRSTRKDVDALLARLDKVAAEAEGAVAQAESVVAKNRKTLRKSLKDLQYTLDLVASNIDTITYNLEGTSRNMNELSRRLRDNPSLLLRTPESSQ